MPRHRKILLSLICVALSASVAACGAGGSTERSSSAKSGTKGTIALMFPGSDQPLVQAIFKHARVEAAKRGYKFVVSDPGTDPTKQAGVISTWIQEGVSAIEAVASDPNVFENLASQARAKNIPFVTYAGILKNESGHLTWPHYTSGYLMGKFAADWVNAHLGGKAEVAVLTWQQAAWGQQRLAGVKAALKKYAPGARIVAEQDAITAPDAAAATDTILQAHPDLNVLLGTTESSATGAYSAFLSNHHSATDPKICIVGADGSPQNIDRIRRGTIFRGDIGLRVAAIGRGVIDVPANILEGKGPTRLLIQPQVLSQSTPDLLNQYAADWK
jgi:ribose transport system substrate-binding protein